MKRRRTSRPRSRRPAVRSAGPDAVHLCLTVGDKLHPFGCAWASYGEACLRGPRSAGRLGGRSYVLRSRRLPATQSPPR